MKLEEQGERIIDAFLDVLLDQIEQYILPNLSRLPIPLMYKMFITDSNARWFIEMAKKTARQLPADMKMALAIKVKGALDEVEERYVRSVMRGKRNEEDGIFLETLGEIKWNGI